MKNFKRILALVLAVMMVATSLMVVTSAADDEVVYNEQAIVRLNKLGIFKGSTSGDMHADDNVTREQMALFTGRVLTGKVATNYWESYVNDTTFEDIDDEAAEYVGAIAYAFEQGIVVGKSDVRFDPKGNVSYQDALTMVVRSLGYTGLSYPNGFINKAIKLGLTADIDGVDYAEAATRGVIATILYNALYAEDSLFAKNFNLTSGLYMLVATPGRELADKSWLEAATIEGYVGKTINAGYVAFAPIDEHNRAINDNYVYARTSEISDDFAGTYASKLGYAYTLTFEDDKLTWADECATTVFKNYGDDRDITSTTIKFQPVKDDPSTPNVNEGAYLEGHFVTFGGQAYALSDGYDPDYMVPTSTQDLILYNVSANAPVNEYKYYFDADGNIVDATGTTIILYKGNNINREADKYYAKNGSTYTVATAQEMYDALSQCDEQTTSGYQILSDNVGYDFIDPNNYNGKGDADGVANVALTLSRNYFCEIVAMDYDGDGIYDAGLYTPYFVGYLSNVGDKFSVTGGYAIGSETTKDWIVSGAATKLNSWNWIIYTVNPLNKEIRIIETLNNIGKKVTWASKGTVTTNTTYGNMYLGSQVKFGDVSYKVGGWVNENLYGLNQIDTFDSGNAGKNNLTGYTFTYDNGWNNILVQAMKAEYSSFKGYAVAGHLIYGYPTLKTTTPADTSNYNFVAFDPYNTEFAINDNDQVVVENALVDTTGTYKSITIDTLVANVSGDAYNNAFTNIAYDAFCDYIDYLYGDNASIIKYSYFFNDAMKAQFTATEAYKNILRANVIEQLYLADIDYGTNNFNSANRPGYGGTQVWTIIEKNADGSLDLRADLTSAYKVVKAGTVTFKLGVADKAMSTKDGKDEAPIATDAETVFTFVAKDGIYTYVGKPADGHKLVLTDSTTLYCADSDAIFVIDETRLVEEIAVGEYDFTSYAKDAENTTFERAHVDTWALNGLEIYMPGIYNYPEIYIVLKDTANKEIYVDEDNNPVYVYTNLYDVVNGKKTDVVFVGADAKVFSDYLANVDGQHPSIDNDPNFKFDPQLMVGTVIYRDMDDTLKFAADEVATGDYKGIMNTAFFANASLDTVDKDNLGAWAHVNGMTVRSVTVKVFLKGGAGVTDDLSKATTGANMYYQYDANTGDFVAYIFNK